MKVEFSKADFKYNCCCCCQSGPINLQVKIPKRGYTPGEAILISAEIENGSSSVISETQAKLIQVCQYKTLMHSKMITETVAECSKGSILPGQSDIWDNVALTVPDIPPTNMDNCKLIDVDYHVLFEVKPDSFVSLDLEVELPVIIGNVQLDPYPFDKQPKSFQTSNQQQIGQANYEIVPSSKILYQKGTIRFEVEKSNSVKHFAWRKII